MKAYHINVYRQNVSMYHFFTRTFYFEAVTIYHRIGEKPIKELKIKLQ